MRETKIKYCCSPINYSDHSSSHLTWNVFHYLVILVSKLISLPKTIYYKGVVKSMGRRADHCKP